jgi:hypothetical protein
LPLNGLCPRMPRSNTRECLILLCAAENMT